MARPYATAEESLWREIAMDYPRLEKAEKTFSNLGVLNDLISTGTKTLYGLGITSLRVPTFIRKLQNLQTMAQRERKVSSANLIGAVTALTGGVWLGFEGISKIVTETRDGNYAPALIVGLTLAGTNTASYLFERGRRQESLRERRNIDCMEDRWLYRGIEDERTE